MKKMICSNFHHSQNGMQAIRMKIPLAHIGVKRTLRGFHLAKIVKRNNCRNQDERLCKEKALVGMDHDGQMCFLYSLYAWYMCVFTKCLHFAQSSPQHSEKFPAKQVKPFPDRVPNTEVMTIMITVLQVGISCVDSSTLQSQSEACRASL